MLNLFKKGGLGQKAHKEDTEGQSWVCDHWHTTLLRRGNVLGIRATLYNPLLYSSALKSPG